MASSLGQLNKQIEKLQREADLLKAKEARGVIARIREAIDQYQLTAADLGFEKIPTPARKRRVSVKAAAEKTGGATKARKHPSPKKASRATKYRDSDGNAWSGRGRPPFWFVAALESGKTREELEVKT